MEGRRIKNLFSGLFCHTAGLVTTRSSLVKLTNGTMKIPGPEDQTRNAQTDIEERTQPDPEKLIFFSQGNLFYEREFSSSIEHKSGI